MSAGGSASPLLREVFLRVERCRGERQTPRGTSTEKSGHVIFMDPELRRVNADLRAHRRV